jgi:hypothetical protein
MPIQRGAKKMSVHADEVDVLISEIKKLLEQARTADLSSTAQILRMARLDLLTVINDIDDNELKAFSESLKTWVQPLDPAPRPVKASSHKPPPLNH